MTRAFAGLLPSRRLPLLLLVALAVALLSLPSAESTQASSGQTVAADWSLIPAVMEPGDSFRLRAVDAAGNGDAAAGANHGPQWLQGGDYGSGAEDQYWHKVTPYEYRYGSPDRPGFRQDQGGAGTPKAWSWPNCPSTTRTAMR